MTTSTVPPVNWAILGPGSIARRFVSQLPSCPGASLVAIGSLGEQLRTDRPVPVPEHELGRIGRDRDVATTAGQRSGRGGQPESGGRREQLAA